MASTMHARQQHASARRRRPLAVSAGVGLLVAGALVAAGATSALAVGVPGSPGYLGAAESYAVLGGSTVTNTGAPTHVWGDVGVSPGTALIGFQTNQVGGAQHAADSSAQNAQLALTDSYNAAAGATRTDGVNHADISNQMFIPGVYNATSSMDLTGTVTLNGGGDPNATWVFQAGTTLTTGSGSRVVVINGNPCNVYWQVGSSATIGSSTSFIGNVLANTSISAVTSATVNGRLLARSGAVTLDSNQITAPVCSVTDANGVTIPAVATPAPTASTGAGTTTPTPGTGAAPAVTATPKATATPKPTAKPTKKPTATPKPTAKPTKKPRATATPSPTATPAGTGGGSDTSTGTPELATTGSDLTPPLSLAAGLMGAGGLLLAFPSLRRAARRRSTARG